MSATSLSDYDSIIIGGGAAGMIAAWRAAIRHNKVLLLEKNKKPGIKILISGGGKCNITNGNDMQFMLKQFDKYESRFLKYSFRTFTNTQLLHVLHEQGVETYTREDGKVFPKSHNAHDVVNALKRLVMSADVEVHLNSPVTGISTSEDGLFNVTAGAEIFRSRSVVIATGGMSYQKTGTTGDGYRWAQQFGHTIVPIRPALAPIYLVPIPPVEWQGTPIRDCLLIALCKNTIVAQWKGDVLFTHLGISGPATLEVSRRAFAAMESGNPVSIFVDFMPELTVQQVDEKLLADISVNANKNVVTLLERYVPQRLAEFIAQQSNINGTAKLHQLKKNERKKIVETLKRCSIGTVKEIPLDRGEVTAGGVMLNEVHSNTMESKLVKGLFLCGEILDIAGPVGGYNLQAAFSTGYVAGNSCIRHESQRHKKPNG